MTTREFIDAFSRVTSHGWLTWEEGLLLVDYAERTRGPIVEVGSYMGRSAMLLGSLGRRLYCVDPWDNAFSSDYPGDEVLRRFKENVRGLDVIPVRCRVEDWEPVPAEFVYLDGDHAYSGSFAQAKQALRCRPVYVAAHDVGDSGGGLDVRRAMVEVFGTPRERLGRLAVWGPMR